MANEQNLIPFTSDQSREEAAKNGRKGGLASGAARRERATLRAVLMEELDHVDEASGLTRRQLLIKKAMANHAKGKLSFKDLKDLADLLGESIQNVSVQTDAPIVAMTPEAIQALGKWASKGAEQEAAGE
jgi:hypothetical protein